MANAGATKQEKAARPRPANVVPPAAWPANTIEMWAADKLRRHPENVRLHPVAQLLVLDGSFAEFGMARPFLINAEGFILAGHGGCDSVEHLHGTGVMIPCCVARGWTKAQELAFMLTDNASAERSSWDKQRLGLQLAEIKGAGYPEASKLGFKAATLKSVGAVVAGVRESKSAEAAPPAQGTAPVSCAGDAWTLGADVLSCASTSPADLAAIDAAVLAWEGCVKKSATLVATGETFAATAAARKLTAAPAS